MKSIKKLAILFICLTLALNMFLVGGPTKESYDSAYLLPEGSYEDILSFWGSSLSASADAMEDNKSDVTPGKPNTVYGNASLSYPATKLADRGSLKYYYEGSNYVYGIDSNGKEIISFKRENGQLYDAVDGAGIIKLVSTKNATLVQTGAVSSFTKSTDQKGNTVLKVDYSLSGTEANTSEVSVYYTFGKTALTLKYEINAQSSEVFSNSKSKISRQYINGKLSVRAQVNEKWIYPDSLDFPYPEFEGLVFIEELTEDLNMYTSLRDSNMGGDQHMVENMNINTMSLRFADTATLSHNYEYTISFVDLTAEKQSPDYLGLFRGMNCDFAAGVAPHTAESDNSTLFVGDKVDLNLNVTNLLDEDIKFSLRYDVRNYYGDVVSAGLYADNMLRAGLDANRTVTVSGKYGMYYLNLYVITENSTYSECYPFALLPEYEYTYKDSNPFGWASAAAGKGSSDFTLSKYTDTANLMLKIGTGTVRAGAEPGYIQLMKTLKANGINKINGGTVPNNKTAEGVESFKNGIVSALSQIEDLIDSAEIGNEMSLYALKEKDDPNYIPTDKLYPMFYHYMHKPALEVFEEYFPNLTYIPTQASACETFWLENFKGYNVPTTSESEFAGTTIPSIWKDIKILTAHIYGDNYMPDVYGCNDQNLGYGQYIWNIETGVQRIAKFLKENLDESGNEKDFYFTEVGYSTPPVSSYAVDLRTQADYFVRIGAITFAYGVDRIQYYQFYDRTSYNSGYVNNNGQWNFGSFYKQDYYGTIKPKPAGVAFAMMTRNLESVKKNSGQIYDKYDEGYGYGGVRAYMFDTAAYGNVLVAYTNAEVLSNGRKDVRGSSNVRTPTLPWNNQWKTTHDTVFDTDNETVKVIDIMGNETIYTAQNGKVTIPLTGSPVYIYGVY